ncbi:diaminopimelate epimerase [Treponema bryantii]|uniref:Diaminopimelate epimerase n=1 Tax=Treponema bryantii TaxID=163 RepID=A0A1H9JAR4_9SPIR|nr:diaminopimelate epimerase [Treponema bryantii]SEQ83877.1 diaminopimelate epimerase [Treponema bryantii]
MKFTKMHGCGNDYIYFDCTKEDFPGGAEGEKQAAIKLSDRHFGIGGDGIIIIKKGTKADFEMVMYNADGSRSQMCGNGIRCVGKYVYDAGYAKGREFTAESMGAVKILKVEEGEPGDKVTKLSVDMGSPILEAEKIPVALKGGRVIQHPLTIAGVEYITTCVSMGNPHAVVFIDKKPSEFPVCEIGPLFENDRFFPERTNTEFAYVEDRRTIWMRVWERGTGETLACGTGTCATAVAAILNGLVDAGEKITVHLLGGDLEIQWSGNEGDSVFMTGPAENVFTGNVDL